MMNDERFCAFIKTDGTRCGAYRVKGSTFCFMHDPQNHDSLREARRRGGKKSQAAAVPGWEETHIGTLADLQEAVQRVFNGVAKGDVHPRTANALVGLGGLLLKLLETTDIEERISRLEAALLKGRA